MVRKNFYQDKKISSEEWNDANDLMNTAYEGNLSKKDRIYLDDASQLVFRISSNPVEKDFYVSNFKKTKDKNTIKAVREIYDEFSDAPGSNALNSLSEDLK